MSKVLRSLRTGWLIVFVASVVACGTHPAPDLGQAPTPTMQQAAEPTVATANDIAVMIRGIMVEFGDTEQVLSRPQHAYTRLLLASIPTLDRKWERPARAVS